VPFVIIQVLMVALIIAFPGLVSSGLSKEPKLDADKLLQQMEVQPRGSSVDIDKATAGSAAASEAGSEKTEDPMKGLLESMKREQEKKP
jgi:GntP family gluconate:H+ symporter